MLYVRIELWPGGRQDQARLLQELTIANDAAGTATYGSYDGTLSHSTTFRGSGLEDVHHPPEHAVWKRGRVIGFPRICLSGSLPHRQKYAPLRPHIKNGQRFLAESEIRCLQQGHLAVPAAFYRTQPDRHIPGISRRRAWWRRC